AASAAVARVHTFVSSRCAVSASGSSRSAAISPASSSRAGEALPMSMTDPIADFLARIRNGIRARKQVIECPRSNIKLRIAEILRDEGFVQAVSSAEDNKQGMLKLSLRYDGRA